MIEKIRDNETLIHFSNMGEAAKFFLNESFQYAEKKLRHWIADEIFTEKIKLIQPTLEDLEVIKDVEKKLSSANLHEILKYDIEVLSKKTQERFNETWLLAQRESLTKKLLFSPKKELGGQSLMGHVTNLAFFIEVLCSRHLVLLKIKEELDDFRFSILDDAAVLNKLIYCFRDELDAKTMTLDKIKHLFKLRNLAVHYNISNAKKFSATIEDLIGIWRDVSKITNVLQKKENVLDVDFPFIIDQFVDFFKKNYVK